MARDFEKGIARATSMYTNLLQNNETIIAEANDILLTSKRILQLNLMGKIKNQLPINDVSEFQTTRKKLAKAGPLLVLQVSGENIDFGNMMDADFERFTTVLAQFKSGQLSSITDSNSQNDSLSQGKLDATDINDANFGNVVSQALFGSASIKIYSNGYIQIAKGFGLIKNNVEKLISIEGEAQITKKTGLGRAAAAVVTMGVNLASPNQRGNLILTITTDKDVHVLFHDVPFAHDIKGMNEIVNAGKAVIARNRRSENESFRPIEMTTEQLGNQLRELGRLRDEGLLNEEEFQAAKRKLLS